MTSYTLRSGINPWLWVAAVAASASAHAQTAHWIGQFESRTLGRTITVELRLPGPAGFGTLRFKQPACELDLEPLPISSPPTRRYTVVSRAKRDPGAMSGPYCGGWLDGSAELRSPTVPPDSLTLTMAKGNSHISVPMRPASPPR